MNLKLLGIEDGGILETERIVISVLADDDVGRFLIFKSVKLGNDVFSAHPSIVFWFPDQKVKKGDFVTLYTKSGTYKSSMNENGNTTHFFYLNKSMPIWTSNDDAVVLLNASWDFKFNSN